MSIRLTAAVALLAASGAAVAEGEPNENYHIAAATGQQLTCGANSSSRTWLPI